MEEELKKILDSHEKKLDAVYKSVEKTRTYFLWALIITAVFVILPLIGLAFAIPQFLGALNSASLGF